MRRISHCTIPFLLLLLTIPLLSPASGGAQQMNQRVFDHDRSTHFEADSLDTRKIQLQAIHHDAEELAALSMLVQTDLQQLQKGVLGKSLTDDLKRMEKLSKRLRQEVQQ